MLAAPAGREFVLRRRRLEILELSSIWSRRRPALAALAIEFAAHLLDRKPQMRDHRLGAGLPRTRLNEIGLSPSEVRLARKDQTLERLDVVRQGGAEWAMPAEPIRARSWGPPPGTESPCRIRAPGSLWMTPVDALQEVAELRRRDRNDPVRGRGPGEATPFQSLGVKRQAEPVMPKHLDQIAAASAEDVEITRMGIAPRASWT